MPRPISKTLAEVESGLRDEANPTDGKRDAPKELVVVRQASGLYAIAFTAGGEVPDFLKGRYTSSVRAQNDIALHLANRLVP